LEGMSMVPYFIGGDVGGTHTRVIITDEDGSILGFGIGGSGNHEGVGYPGFEAEVSKSTTQALSKAGLSIDQIKGAAFGIGGYDWPSQRQPHLDSLAKVGYTMPIEIVNDTVIGIVAGSEEGWGIGIVSGTGCNCWGWDHGRNKIAHLTGGGSWMGEAAGAGEVVAQAIRAVSHAWSGRGPQTQLSQVFAEMVGAKNAEDLLEGMMDLRFQIRSSAAPLVFKTAYAGDPVAIKIIQWAGTELGEMAKTIIKQLGFEALSFDAVMIGSMWEGGSLLIDQTRETIQDYAPDARIVRLTAPPVAGGVLLGMEAAGYQPGHRIRERLIEESSSLFSKIPTGR
jgi:N-acetylglucosamine kinase-like BadF-type ATPase